MTRMTDHSHMICEATIDATGERIVVRGDEHYMLLDNPRTGERRDLDGAYGPLRECGESRVKVARLVGDVTIAWLTVTTMGHWVDTQPPLSAEERKLHLALSRMGLGIDGLWCPTRTVDSE